MEKIELFRQLFIKKIGTKNSWGKNELINAFYEIFYLMSKDYTGNDEKSSQQAQKVPLTGIPEVPPTQQIADMAKMMTDMQIFGVGNKLPSRPYILNGAKDTFVEDDEFVQHEFDKADNNDHDDYVPF